MKHLIVEQDRLCDRDAIRTSVHCMVRGVWIVAYTECQPQLAVERAARA